MHYTIPHDFRHHATPGVRLARRIARGGYRLTVITSTLVIAIVLLVGTVGV